MTNIIKFLSAGNVDDGKSTLIGRLLHDTNSLYQDQIDEVKASTNKDFDANIDYSLFLDGLSSERCQKITIDVAYRYFSYQGQKFIIADAPGHQQYTKNMAVAAANSDIIIILIDASKKITSQTKKHSYIASLFGIKNVIIAINKMDLVNYEQKVFNEIKNDYLKFAQELNFSQINFVAISALKGFNIIKNDGQISWYKDKSIMQYLTSFNDGFRQLAATRLQIQNIIKDQNQRYYQGLVLGQDLKVGDKIVAYPSRLKSKVTTIIHSNKKVKKASDHNSVAVTLDDDIDLERGGILVKESSKIEFVDHINAKIIWFSNDDFDITAKKNLIIKINHNYFEAKIILSNKNIIKLNDIANISLKLSNKVAFDYFDDHKNTASFLLINPNDNQTLACGVIKRDLEELKKKPPIFTKLINKFIK